MLIKRKLNIGSNDINVIYRPCKISEIVGNEIIKNIIGSCLNTNKLAHTYLFTGERGCGKTTIARIIAMGLNCIKGVTSEPCVECDSCLSILNRNNIDVIELNIGHDNTKAAVEKLIETFQEAPMFSDCKVIIFDEAHELTTKAQNILLKILEDGFSHVYFIFCTNQPNKLNDAFIRRCQVIEFKRNSNEEIYNIISNIAMFEGMSYNDSVLNYIADNIKGIPGEAVQLLKTVNDEGSWSIDYIKSLLLSNVDSIPDDVVIVIKSLLRGDFNNALDYYKKIDTKPDFESMRIFFYSFIAGCLIKTADEDKRNKYSKILTHILSDPIYDTGKLGYYKFINIMYRISAAVKGVLI